MLGKAIKQAVNKPITGTFKIMKNLLRIVLFLKGDRIEDIFFETGVDIAEALDLVNISIDSSKDFSEKEVSVTELNIEKRITDEKQRNKLFLDSKVKNVPMRRNNKLLRLNITDANIKITSVENNAIKRGKVKADVDKSLMISLQFPIFKIIPSSPKLVHKIFDRELIKECKSLNQGQNKSIKLSKENKAEHGLIFETKCFLDKIWSPSELSIYMQKRSIQVCGHQKSFIEIDNIIFVKVGTLIKL